MKGIGCGMVWLLLGGMSVAQVAVARSCGEERPAVSHLFCAHPALATMDRTLQALAMASPDASVRRDQRIWQSQRDDVLWRLLSNRSFTGDAVLRRAWHLERSRQAFLLGVAGHGAVTLPPMQRMQRSLRAHPGAVGDPLAVWARYDPDVSLARTLTSLPNRLSQALARLELRPDRVLSQRVELISNGNPWFDLLWLPDARLGAVVSVQGTDACQLMVWFRADRDGTARVIPAPMLDQVPCGRTRLTLLRVGYDTYVALQRIDDPYAVDVSVQQWLDGRWASPLRQRMRYDHGLRLGRLRCDGRACGSYAAVMMRIARRYDASPQGRYMAVAKLAPDERVRARQLLRLAARERKTILGSMPLAGNEVMTTFCSDASFVLVRVHGRLLLGRIGHGYLGWRRSDGWRIGLWGMHGGKLEAVASAVIRRPRGRLLATAAMPPAVIPTR